MRCVSVFILCLTLLVLVGAEVGSASAAGDLEISVEGKPLKVGAPITTASSTGMTVGPATASSRAKKARWLALSRPMTPPRTDCNSRKRRSGVTSPTGRNVPARWRSASRPSRPGDYRGRWTSSRARQTGSSKEARRWDSRSRFRKSRADGRHEGDCHISLPMGEEELPLELSLSGVTLKRAKGSAAACPSTGTFEEPAIAVSDQAQTVDHYNDKPKKKGNK